MRLELVFAIVGIFFFDYALLASVRDVELKNGWILTNQNGSIRREVSLPSGVYSAFNLTNPEQVLESYNDVNMRWIAYDNWTYALEFERPNDYNVVQFIKLTFHGIDTISKIVLNNKTLDETNNMFVRYSYNIKHLLEEKNFLQVHIKSPIYAAKNLAESNTYTPPNCPPARYNGECHMNFLRKMQASFSWDWGLAAPSMGIWKPVVLEIHDIAIIRDVDVALSRANGTWTMFIRVFLETGLDVDFYGELTFYAVELFDGGEKITLKDKPLSKKNPVIEFSWSIDENNVELWWPNGYGQQKLYHLHFTWNGWLSPTGPDPRKLSMSYKSIRIGFRTLELVQEPIYNGDSFFFRINGVPMFMKGTNYIPSHILPEKSHDQNRIKHLLESVKDANMNMIRVWGGGIYESDYFYDMADYLGILIWQDMMFACAMYPTSPEFIKSVREETIQNAKRIAYHPSIAVWAANNENEVALAQNWYNTSREYDRFAKEYLELYVGNIYHELSIISHSSRPTPLMSSPSNGRKSQEEKYLSKNPQNPNYGDIHFYEYLKDGWNPNIYHIPRFSSEYGFQSLPAMSAWKRTIGANDSLEQLINHRQHFPLGSVPIIGLILRHLPLPPKDSANYIEALIYFSQITQAMATKVETEVYRSQRNTVQNTMGALYWQLNDVWISPSWSSIDFYGNYKLLHFWAKEFMAPISIIAHLDSSSSDKRINIYIARDTIEDETLELTINLKIYMWSYLFPKKEFHWPTTIKPNTVKLVKLVKIADILESPLTPSNCFFEFSLMKGRDNLAKTYFFPDYIKKAEGIKDPAIEVEISSAFCQIPINSVSIALKVQAPAVFVYIEIIHENITTYKLSRNGFMQIEPIQTVHLEFNKDSCETLEPKHVKILTVNQFMV